MTRKRRPVRQRLPAYTQHIQPPENIPQLTAAILDVVDSQLRDGTPPETRQTFERLIGAGYTPEGARQLIAHVVVREIFSVMGRGERYDQARFVGALQRLPELPDAEDPGG